MPASGRFRWHVNPSQRPLAILAGRREAWTLTCGGQRRRVVLRRTAGQARDAPLRSVESGRVSSSVDTDRRDLLTAVALETTGAVGDDFLVALVESVGTTFGAGVCWVSELVEGRSSARALACWPAEALPAGEEYPLEGTPCVLVHDRAVVAYTSDVTGAFPEDDFLAEHGLDGYVALPATDSTGARHRLPRRHHPAAR